MTTSNLFHNASLKLTSLYLIIIMFISLVFSIGIYNVSSSELENNIRKPGNVGEILRGRNKDLIEDLLAEEKEAVMRAQDRLKSNLLLINVVILIFGGLLSYYLARLTLQPVEEAHEAQSRFTADASHELRTPITAMRAETELALTDDKLTVAKARKQLESNIEELDKLTSLSDGLLQLARLDNNGLEKELVPIGHVIEQAVERVSKKAAQKQQSIAVKNVPDVELHANQMAITEALVTLLDNAVKYSPEKSEITVNARTTKRKVQISVKDHGVGIRASELAHVFERFYRADASRDKNAHHGYGIGLSIAQSVAEAHNGTVTAKSTPQKGSTFTLTLPL